MKPHTGGRYDISACSQPPAQQTVAGTLLLTVESQDTVFAQNHDSEAHRALGSAWSHKAKTL